MLLLATDRVTSHEQGAMGSEREKQKNILATEAVFTARWEDNVLVAVSAACVPVLGREAKS